MVALSGTRTDLVADTNAEACWLTPGQLKIMIIKYLSAEKISRFFNQQTAQTFLFKMRYDSLLNPGKWPSDVQKGSANSSFCPSHTHASRDIDRSRSCYHLKRHLCSSIWTLRNLKMLIFKILDQPF